MVWQLRPISPNYGKPVAAGWFESATWLGELAIWATGEAEVTTVRMADGWNVNKHHDLTSADDLEKALDELAALISEASVPVGALATWLAPERKPRSSQY